MSVCKQVWLCGCVLLLGCRPTGARVIQACIALGIVLICAHCGEGDDTEKGSLTLDAYAAEQAEL